MQEWLWRSASELGRGIGAGEIDPLALCETYLAAIDAHEFRDRIYARVTHDRARAEATAAASRARAGQRLGPLDGVPISWKDLFDTAGIATEAGTAMMKGRVPEQDAEVLANATAQGLVCLGKTHMSEIAFSGLGLNPITATAPCKHDETAVAGGSSSGAAASVAYGLAAAAIGSDTGGSVRIPSVWNDLVGMKTTFDSLPMMGAVPLCTEFDTIGPLCRTVEDANLLIGALSGEKPADLGNVTLKNTRLMVLETIVQDDVEGAPAAAFKSAIHRLHAAGAEITYLPMPEMERAYALAGPLFTADAYANWRDLVVGKGAMMYPQILERVMSGSSVLAHDYLADWHELRGICKVWQQAVAGFDAVISPTAPILPPNAERLQNDGEYYLSANLMALRNTRVANLMGLPSLTLPTGVNSCGILFNGIANQDAALMRLGRAAEAALA